MDTLAKLRSLDADEWRVLAEAALLIPVVRMRLRIFGLARLLAARQSPSRSARESSDLPPRRVAALVVAASNRFPLHASCLARSLVLDRLLRARGFAPELRIGVRVERGGLDAHAWIECDGQPLDDAPDVASRYATFDGPVPLEAFAR